MRTQIIRCGPTAGQVTRIVLLPGAYHELGEFVDAGFDRAVRERGSGDLWLGGVSLGGFMALRFAAQCEHALDGLCLLAPYLGSRIVAAEVAAHANLSSCQPGALPAASTRVIPGGHDWPVWRALWDSFLDRMALRP
jgi:pimeloyl-ACP methyl ester carboxylesterase